MQIDLHFTGIYVLCRLVGMKSQYAYIVAYASQQVDDADYGHALKFENGGVFDQRRTSYRGLSVLNFDMGRAVDIWIPFHFFPGGVSKDNPDGLITEPKSKPVVNLMRKIKGEGSSPLALYWLGIGLHVLLDSFAHQGFKGFYDRENDIELLTGFEEKGLIHRVKEFMIKRSSFFLPIGHFLALSNPDLPRNFWSYKKQDGSIIKVDNLNDRYLPALKVTYEYLKDYLQVNNIYCQRVNPQGFRVYEDKFKKLLYYEGGISRRSENWLKAIHRNYFEWEGFDEIDKNLSYHPRQWFREAVKVIKIKNPIKALQYRAYNYYMFERKPDFYESNWVKFMQAVFKHRYEVISKILPCYGVILG